MSLGCYLQVFGKNFDVDQFLKLSKFDAHIVFYRGNSVDATENLIRCDFLSN